MARYERDFGAGAPEPLTPQQVLELLGTAESGKRASSDAVARFLAGGDDWKEALHELRGAFAQGERGLIDGQSE